MPRRASAGRRPNLIETAFRTFRVQVHRFPVPLTNAQRDDAQRLALELRFGLDWDPQLQVAVQRLSHALLGTGPIRLRRPDATLETQRFFQRLIDFLEDHQAAGRLVVLLEPAIANVPELELTVRRPRQEARPPAELVPRREPPPETSFEARFVDKLRVQIQAGDRNAQVTTNAAGVALLEGGAAMRAADTAVNEVLGSLQFNASLAPVLGHAAGRVLASRRG